MLFHQDLEGLLNINDNGIVAEVLNGHCQDFFEFREVIKYIIKL